MIIEEMGERGRNFGEDKERKREGKKKMRKSKKVRGQKRRINGKMEKMMCGKETSRKNKRKRESGRVWNRESEYEKGAM